MFRPIEINEEIAGSVDPKGNIVLERFDNGDAVVFTGGDEPFTHARGYDRRSGTWESGEAYADMAECHEAADPEIIDQWSVRWRREDIADLLGEQRVFALAGNDGNIDKVISWNRPGSESPRDAATSAAWDAIQGRIDELADGDLDLALPDPDAPTAADEEFDPDELRPYEKDCMWAVLSERTPFVFEAHLCEDDESPSGWAWDTTIHGFDADGRAVVGLWSPEDGGRWTGYARAEELIAECPVPVHTYVPFIGFPIEDVFSLTKETFKEYLDFKEYPEPGIAPSCGHEGLSEESHEDPR